MRISIPLIFAFLFLPFLLSAQKASQENVDKFEVQLKYAREEFEAGRVNVAVELLEKMFPVKDYFKKNKEAKGHERVLKSVPPAVKVDAYKLLIEAYVYLEEEEKADAVYRTLLDLDPNFRTKKNLDSPEFAFLSQNYRVQPKFSFALSGGLIQTSKYGISIVEIDDESTTSETDYPFVLGNQFSIGVNYHPFNTNFEIGLEVGRTVRKRDFREAYENSPLPNGERGRSSFAAIEEQKWLDVSLGFQYNFSNSTDQRLVPTVGLRLNYHNLLDGQLLSPSTVFPDLNTLNVTNFIPLFKDPSPGDNDPVPELRNSSNISIAPSVGLKCRVNRHYVFARLQNTWFFQNIPNADNRFANNRLLTVYNYVDNDFKQYDFSLSIGFQFAIYQSGKI